MPHPASVYVADEVAPARIASGVTLHPGCRLLGARTAIGAGSALGAESPMTVEDCQLGEGVELKGGYAAGAVFLDGSNVGSGAHIRPGTILEEEASAAHAVGFKQTILLPYVTTGSLINLCDCLMAGGTSRKNHSEVGSSYIHFNFTPHQDKATASLIGDVPRGVMLDQPPVFLGGQGGLVGPVRLGYGTVIPAGTIWRSDVTQDHQLLTAAPAARPGVQTYHPGCYRDARRILRNNLVYLGNVRALRAWYVDVRATVMSGLHARFCREGAIQQLDAVLSERRKRLGEWVGKLAGSAAHLEQEGTDRARREAEVQRRITQHWPALEEALDRGTDGAGTLARESFLKAWSQRSGEPYLKAVAGLSPEQRQHGVAWLQALVDVTAAAGRAVEGD